MIRTKTSVIILILLLIMCFDITAYAVPPLPDADQFIALGEAMKGKDAVKAQADEVAIAFIPILQTLGNLFIILTISIMGIRWLYAEPKRRAELKEGMIAYVIGVAVVFCGINITAIVTNYFETQFKVGPYKGTLVVIKPSTYNNTTPGTVPGGSYGVPSSGSASPQIISFIASYEGYAAYAYRGVDFWNRTIGYGHVIRSGESFREPMSQEEAKALLSRDMERYVNPVKQMTAGLSLSQNQFDALVSFAYNCGPGALKGSTLLRDIKAGASSEVIKKDFLVWSKCLGITLPGLYKRRMDEYMMFTTGDYARS